MVIIAATLIVAYALILCVTARHIPNSLSQSVFYLPQSASWIWTVDIGFFALAIMPPFIEKTPQNWQWLAFISCFGLLLVAVAPLLPAREEPTQDGGTIIDNSDLAYKVHMAGAFIAAIGSQALIAVCKTPVLLCWIPFLAAFIWITKDSGGWRTKVFWAELPCFLTTIVYISV